MIKALTANNRRKNFEGIMDIIRFLSENDPEFSKLEYRVKFDLAAKFFQFEKGKLQKNKIYIDIIAHVIPLVVSLAALLIAMKK